MYIMYTCTLFWPLLCFRHGPQCYLSSCKSPLDISPEKKKMKCLEIQQKLFYASFYNLLEHIFVVFNISKVSKEYERN